MTNKQEHYFVVSAAELETVMQAVWKEACEWHGMEMRPGVSREEAEAACRARPFTREMYAEICAKVDREQKNGDFAGSFFEGVCKYLFGEVEK